MFGSYPYFLSISECRCVSVSENRCMRIYYFGREKAFDFEDHVLPLSESQRWARLELATRLAEQSIVLYDFFFSKPGEWVKTIITKQIYLDILSPSPDLLLFLCWYTLSANTAAKIPPKTYRGILTVQKRVYVKYGVVNMLTIFQTMSHVKFAHMYETYCGVNHIALSQITK